MVLFQIFLGAQPRVLLLLPVFKTLWIWMAKIPGNDNDLRIPKTEFLQGSGSQQGPQQAQNVCGQFFFLSQQVWVLH